MTRLTILTAAILTINKVAVVPLEGLPFAYYSKEASNRESLGY
jgi:hypothetical protein